MHPHQEVPRLSTTVDNQPTITIHVFDGERAITNLLGKSKTASKFEIDANGILEVGAVENGKSNPITNSKNPLSDSIPTSRANAATTCSGSVKATLGATPHFPFGEPYYLISLSTSRANAARSPSVKAELGPTPTSPFG
ncbi:ATPase with role in protein import into the ER [Tulasnella sp. UAMH 9824]|nr:ATPase with role in protein import into the ER [Tulasnella sp. UAMH 9824]